MASSPARGMERAPALGRLKRPRGGGDGGNPDSRKRVLPMELRVGDRFRDETGEWEVVGRPFTMRAGKIVHAQVRRVGDAGSAQEATWPAHERVEVKRQAPE